MINKIESWSWDKPTREGDYLYCRGDVETQANTKFVRLTLIGGVLIDDEGNDINEYHSSFKFALLVYRGSELAELDK